ncbi:MAG: hypothetical protein ACI83H_002705, partial [Glaciecola sp.]
MGFKKKEFSDKILINYGGIEVIHLKN